MVREGGKAWDDDRRSEELATKVRLFNWEQFDVIVSAPTALWRRAQGV